MPTFKRNNSPPMRQVSEARRTPSTGGRGGEGAGGWLWHWIFLLDRESGRRYYANPPFLIIVRFLSLGAYGIQRQYYVWILEQLTSDFRSKQSACVKRPCLRFRRHSSGRCWFSGWPIICGT